MLEIGTGSGYLTALLASRGAQVTSVEIIPRLPPKRKAKLTRAGIAGGRARDRATARADGATQPYDAIVLTGSTPILPDAFIEQLKPGGRALRGRRRARR